MLIHEKEVKKLCRVHGKTVSKLFLQQLDKQLEMEIRELAIVKQGRKIESL
jgi:hypothetical protein